VAERPQPRFGADGLVCAVVQDAASGAVLMVAWMDREAWERTLADGDATFFSRSRGRLWRKGETSGNVMRVRAVRLDCDRDTVLLSVDPAGPACHTGAPTCFVEEVAVG
jgi:phosphoribosyl-AMP cyclohydrolase